MNGVTLAAKTDIILLYADKNNKIIQVDHQNTKNQTNPSTNAWKKNGVYQTKTFKEIIAKENHFQLAIIITDHNPLILISFAEDQQIDEFHKINHKTDILDEIVKKISTETITPMEVISQI